MCMLHVNVSLSIYIYHLLFSLGVSIACLLLGHLRLKREKKTLYSFCFAVIKYA